jgi:hypothetical protein
MKCSAEFPILTLSQLNQIIDPCGKPNSAAVGENISCDNALRPIQSAFKRYNIRSPEARAMYLSTMSIESGNLTYVKNHWPGRPGQGTYSMMMPINLYTFVKDNKKIFESNPIYSLTIGGEYNDENNSSKVAIINELIKPEFAFLPGAWWIERGAKIANGCSIDMNASPSLEQATKFISSCIGVEANEARLSAYTSALKVLKK